MSSIEGNAGVEWVIDFAFKCGVDGCAIIPTRQGNGAIEQLQNDSILHHPI